MRAKARLAAAALVLTAAGIWIGGCGSPPPPGAVYASRRPPPDRVEVVTVRPGPGHVWIGGHWRWDQADYVWVPGHWVPVERGYHRWVPGRWHHGRRGWYYLDGHWR
ncbi:MAG TPA: YXWGXW repeat-containing protein [Gemmatimonadales bacterium]|jgi:hypothetical protein